MPISVMVIMMLVAYNAHKCNGYNVFVVEYEVVHISELHCCSGSGGPCTKR